MAYNNFHCREQKDDGSSQVHVICGVPSGVRFRDFAILSLEAIFRSEDEDMTFMYIKFRTHYSSFESCK